jgi:hypothetical protein
MRKLIAAMLKGEDRDSWSSQQWYEYLLGHADSQREKDDIHAMFNRT